VRGISLRPFFNQRQPSKKNLVMYVYDAHDQEEPRYNSKRRNNSAENRTAASISSISSSTYVHPRRLYIVGRAVPFVPSAFESNRSLLLLQPTLAEVGGASIKTDQHSLALLTKFLSARLLIDRSIDRTNDCLTSRRPRQASRCPRKREKDRRINFRQKNNWKSRTEPLNFYSTAIMTKLLLSHASCRCTPKATAAATVLMKDLFLIVILFCSGSGSGAAAYCPAVVSKPNTQRTAALSTTTTHENQLHHLSAVRRNHHHHHRAFGGWGTTATTASGYVCVCFLFPSSGLAVPFMCVCVCACVVREGTSTGHYCAYCFLSTIYACMHASLFVLGGLPCSCRDEPLFLSMVPHQTCLLDSHLFCFFVSLPWHGTKIHIPDTNAMYIPINSCNSFIFDRSTDSFHQTVEHHRLG
jgi:hypothetical protein